MTEFELIDGEKIIKKIKGPAQLTFIECPKCDGYCMTLYEAHKGIIKRKLCDCCGGQGFVMSKKTREEFKQALGWIDL